MDKYSLTLDIETDSKYQQVRYGLYKAVKSYMELPNTEVRRQLILDVCKDKMFVI